MGNPELEAKLEGYVGIEIGPPERARDAVNPAAIGAWCDAMGDRNPVYSDPDAAARSAHGGLVAPPTMLQAWILPGIAMARSSGAPRDKQGELHALLEQYGYTSPVATNCEQHYHRYLRPGDRISAATRIESISEEKATAVGIGYFIDTRTVFTDQDGEEVGWMTFRVLKFRPGEAAQRPTADGGAPPKPGRIRAPRGHDNGWWWEAVDRGEIRIQRCGECGALRHPPRPMCHRCQSLEWDSVEASGRGSVYSYVILHHPKMPGYDYPLPVGLIDLEEGTRLLSNISGCRPEEIHVGMPVQGGVEEVEEGLRLPLFRPAS